MEEEIIGGLILGIMFGTPIGWFLKSAFVWRRAAQQVEGAQGRSVQTAPAVAREGVAESRAEKLLQRVGERLEAVEDRLDFTERLLDARRTEARREAAESGAGAGGPVPTG